MNISSNNLLILKTNSDCYNQTGNANHPVFNKKFLLIRPFILCEAKMTESPNECPWKRFQFHSNSRRILSHIKFTFAIPANSVQQHFSHLDRDHPTGICKLSMERQSFNLACRFDLCHHEGDIARRCYFRTDDHHFS